MNKNNVKRYLRKMMNDVIAVDTAISNGANLNELEWFDFMVKSSLLEYFSGNTHKYWLFNREDCNIAVMYQDALCVCIEAKIQGYSNKTAVSVMRRMTRHVNKCFGWSRRVRMIHWDENGMLKFQYCRGKAVWLEQHVQGVDSLVSAIIDLVEMGAADSYSDNCSLEFAELLTGYITRELKRMDAGEMPEPVMGGTISKPLIDMIHGGKKAANKIEEAALEDKQVDGNTAKEPKIIPLPRVAK